MHRYTTDMLINLVETLGVSVVAFAAVGDCIRTMDGGVVRCTRRWLCSESGFEGERQGRLGSECGFLSRLTSRFGI